MVKYIEKIIDFNYNSPHVKTLHLSQLIKLSRLFKNEFRNRFRSIYKECGYPDIELRFEIEENGLKYMDRDVRLKELEFGVVEPFIRMSNEPSFCLTYVTNCGVGYTLGSSFEIVSKGMLDLLIELYHDIAMVINKMHKDAWIPGMNFTIVNYHNYANQETPELPE